MHLSFCALVVQYCFVNPEPLPELPQQTSVRDFPTVADYESAARQIMAPSVYEYVAGGAGDEISLRANRTAFDRIFLLPRVLRNVTPVDSSTTLFGKKLAAPILLAPIAYQCTMHPEGELATVRGAGMAGAHFVVSTNTTVQIEDLASEAKAPICVSALFAERPGLYPGTYPAGRGCRVRGPMRNCRHAGARS